VVKIAQITDLHIGPEDILYNGIDVRVNFLKCLKVALQKNPDYIVLSGDLAIDFGEIEAYYWVKEQMDQCGVPYLVMSGNHDSVERMKKVFHLEDKLYQNMLCYRFDFLNKYPAFFLDSEPDLIAEEQLVWLLEETKKNRRRGTTIYTSSTNALRTPIYGSKISFAKYSYSSKIFIRNS
jgi:Icc protein